MNLSDEIIVVVHQSVRMIFLHKILLQSRQLEFADRMNWLVGALMR